MRGRGGSREAVGKGKSYVSDIYHGTLCILNLFICVYVVKKGVVAYM